MDAPFHGRVATDDLRKEGRSEKFFQGYDESYLISQLENIFNHIKKRFPKQKIVIQIARGKAAEWTKVEILDPLLSRSNITDVEYVYGYRTDKYYKSTDDTPTDDTPFVFVNYGMFAVLSNVDNIKVAEICNPNKTFSINYIKELSEFESDYTISSFDDDKNIMNELPEFKKLTLIGIDDKNEFITNENYKKESIDKLIRDVDLVLNKS
jgi:hypothetical protein